jgi:low temperature requirement protein LtrA
MNLPREFKQPWIVFLSAFTIICFGAAVIYLAVGRMRQSGQFDRGFVLGIAFIVWGVWVLWAYKPEQKS